MFHLTLAAALLIDLGAVFVLTYVVYYRRHRRRDLLLSYVALNVGLFAVVSALTTATADIALGFGLFAVLSIIRLRSDAITQEEVAYYFVTLVLGLVNGLGLPSVSMTLILNVGLVAVMFVVDHRRVLAGAQRRMITLDVVHTDDVALVADLERRLGARVQRHVVTEVDYVRDVTVVDVRFTMPRQPALAVQNSESVATAPAQPRLAGLVHQQAGNP